MSSSSIILSNILESESCELRKAIDAYMDTKLKELQNIMKSKLDIIISNKIDKFYNKSFEEHENILFDKNGENLINEHNSYIERNFLNTGRSHTYFQIIEFKSLNFLSKENTKCFTITFENSYDGRGNHIRELSFYKTFLIDRNSYPPSSGSFRHWNITSFKHNLTSDCLFAIKYFQVADNHVQEACCRNVNLNTSIKLLEEHPEYFKKNCSDFEDICRKEYAEIEKTKLQLKSLIDEQISKKDYYESLEKKIKDMEKKQLEEEKLF
jgi:hypothetical protein